MVYTVTLIIMVIKEMVYLDGKDLKIGVEVIGPLLKTLNFLTVLETIVLPNITKESRKTNYNAKNQITT